MALFKAPDADDLWLGHLFRTYPMSAEVGVPLLVRLLDHPSDHVKGHAVQLLQYRYGAQAKDALPKLIRLLNDKGPREWWLREWVARALGEIAPHDVDVAAALIASIKNKEPAEPVNRGSIEVLGRFGPVAGDGLDVVRKYVTSPDPETQIVAYRSVGQIVNAGRPSQEDLKKLTAVDWKAADGGYAVSPGSRTGGGFPCLPRGDLPQDPVCVKGTVIETLGKLKSATRRRSNCCS